MQDGGSIVDGIPFPIFVALEERGYSFWYLKPEEVEGALFVEVRQAGNAIASAEFSDEGGAAFCQNIDVHASHRRQGIASAAYAFSEAIYEKSLVNAWDGSPQQSEAARALWANPNRIFGR